MRKVDRSNSATDAAIHGAEHEAKSTEDICHHRDQAHADVHHRLAVVEHASLVPQLAVRTEHAIEAGAVVLCALADSFAEVHAFILTQRAALSTR